MLTDELQRLRVAVERVEREVEGCAFPYVREAAEAVERAVVDYVLDGISPADGAAALSALLSASGSGVIPKPLQDVIDEWFEAETRRRVDKITAKIREMPSNEELLRMLDEDMEALGPIPAFGKFMAPLKQRSPDEPLPTVAAGMADEPAFTIVDTTKPQYPVVSLGKAMRIGKSDEDDFFSRYR